ncbi:MAG TPA: hypothetical protein VMD02_07645 [Candidatus Omnitrophota bacterium]|nr:hypothetical protein [Candidatus Omnitrophota bacterium]
MKQIRRSLPLAVLSLLILQASAFCSADFKFVNYIGEAQAKLTYCGELGIGMELLGYQEHVANVSIGGPAGNIDSSASPNYYSVNGRLEMAMGNAIYAVAAHFPLSASPVTEKWTFNGGDYQTNDLSYTLTRFDACGGYSFSDLFQLLGGIRISKGEQTRENFYQNGSRLSTGQVVETIDSFNALVKLRGMMEPGPVRFGYELEAAYPIKVSTVNTQLSGLELGASGDSYAAAVTLSCDLDPGSSIDGAIRWSTVHYDGSGWHAYGAGQVQWPINDTQDLGISAGWRHRF